MKKRQFISSALAGALCLTALCGCQGGDKSETRTAVAEVGTVESIVSDTGTVAYRDPYAVIPTVNGKILTCAIEEGDAVIAGQTLYTIDSTALEDQITQAALSRERPAGPLSGQRRLRGPDGHCPHRRVGHRCLPPCGGLCECGHPYRRGGGFHQPDPYCPLRSL